MTTNFQQQSAGRNLNFSKSAPSPQHGQRASPELIKRADPRALKGKRARKPPPEPQDD